MDKLFDGEILSIEVLGSKEKIHWKHKIDGLHITSPDNLPCEHALSFKIKRKNDL